MPSDFRILAYGLPNPAYQTSKPMPIRLPFPSLSAPNPAGNIMELLNALFNGAFSQELAVQQDVSDCFEFCWTPEQEQMDQIVCWRKKKKNTCHHQLRPQHHTSTSHTTRASAHLVHHLHRTSTSRTTRTHRKCTSHTTRAAPTTHDHRPHHTSTSRTI